MTFDPISVGPVGPIGLATGAAGLVLLLALATGRAVRARRRRRREDATSSDPVVGTTASSDVSPEPEPEQEPGPEPEEAEVVAETTAGTVVPGEASLLVRSLRAQVRTLEQTLEDLREVSDRIPATEPADVPADAEPAASYRRQVALTLRALAARPLPGETAEHALARVAAAVERLDGSDRLVRPALPQVTGAPAVSGVGPARRPIAAVPAWAPEPEDVTEAAAQTVPEPAAERPEHLERAEHLERPEDHERPEQDAAEPVDSGDPTEAAEAADTADTADAAAEAAHEPEVVLPVPPPLVEEPRRNRRWLRRHAA